MDLQKITHITFLKTGYSGTHYISSFSFRYDGNFVFRGCMLQFNPELNQYFIKFPKGKYGEFFIMFHSVSEFRDLIVAEYLKQKEE